MTTSKLYPSSDITHGDMHTRTLSVAAAMYLPFAAVTLYAVVERHSMLPAVVVTDYIVAGSIVRHCAHLSSNVTAEDNSPASLRQLRCMDPTSSPSAFPLDDPQDPMPGMLGTK